MNDFEQKLRELPVRQPSFKLRNRVFHAPHKQRSLFHRRVSLGWAVAASLAVGLIGFGLAKFPQKHNPQPVRQVRAIYGRTAPGNMLDFSANPDPLFSGNCTILIHKKKNGDV